MNTSVADTMELSGEKTVLDQHVVKLFSHKAILALLIKYCVQELKDYSADYIMENCFVGEPYVGQIAVDQDMPDLPGAPPSPPKEYGGLEEEPTETGKDVSGSADDSDEVLLDGNARIQGMNTVDKTQKEGTVIYDIIFQLRVPGTEELIRLIINVEIQNDKTLEYPVVTRGLYYCARMISSQKNRVFFKSEYQKIRKVYSIWICPYARNGLNSVTGYRIQETIHEGGEEAGARKQDYDKLETIVITLNAEGIKSQNELVHYLSLLLTREVPLSEREKELEEKYHIQMTDDIRKDVSAVCNYSDAILDQGIQQGISQGINQGIEIGEVLGAIKAYSTLGLSVGDIKERIIDGFSLTAEKAEQYIQRALGVSV